MKHKRNILLFLILNIAFSSVVFAQGEGGSGGMLLLNNSPLTESLFNSKGFSGLFSTLLNIIITLAAIWAVIELSYYGAKYALLDSFTGKKDAIKNIWPVAYGLIALLGIVLFFKQINPKILQLEFSSANLKDKISLSEKLRDVDIKNAHMNSMGTYVSQESIEQERKRKEELKRKISEINKEFNNKLPKKEGFSSKTQKGDSKLSQEEFIYFCMDNGKNTGQCAVTYNRIRNCSFQAKSCDKITESDLDLFNEALKADSNQITNQ